MATSRQDILVPKLPKSLRTLIGGRIFDIEIVGGKLMLSRGPLNSTAV